MSAPLTPISACIAEGDAPAAGLMRFAVDLEIWTSLSITIDAEDELTAREFAKQQIDDHGEDAFEFVNGGYNIGEITRLDPPYLISYAEVNHV